ncbi:MAG TPA: YkvA family protein [Candidatus Binatia bacterium]
MWRIEAWKQKARELRTEIYALYLAVKNPRVPWYVKFSAVCVVAYALSPIDIIPDFIPVLGYVDDLILVPLGIALTIRMIPPEVLAECRANAQLKVPQGKFLGWIGAILVLAFWVVIIFTVVRYFS